MFTDREVSLLKFNERVLEEAICKHNPILERINFLGIVSKNIDEFYKTRFHKINEEKFNENSIKDIHNSMLRLLLKKKKAYKILLSNLKKNNIIIQNTWSPKGDVIEENCDVQMILDEMVMVSKEDGLRGLKCGDIYVCVLVEDENETERFLLYSLGRKDRLIKIINSEENFRYVLRENFILQELSKKFAGKILSKCVFRITRDSSLIFKDFNKDNYLSFIEKSVKKRMNGTILRLEVYKNNNNIILEYFKEKFQLEDINVFKRDIPIDLSFLMELKKYIDNKSLKFGEFSSKIPRDFKEKEDFFSVIRKKDILLHHPFDSFEVLTSILSKAVEDENVISIKQTLYRVSANSKIVKMLIEAAKRGIKVTVLLELRARFDEDNNILWAKKLEESGCNVIYGVKGLKTHAKVLLITRKEDGELERFIHVSTGNYNEITAKLYTDIALISSRKELTRDVSKFFNMITGVSEYVPMESMYISPLNMRDEFVRMINNEIKNVQNGHKGKIIAKFNSLEDKKLIKLLTKAAKKGVKIKLIVRGICCMKITDDIRKNVEIRSIVGRFLEHSRIYYFYNRGDEKIFISSADLMERNLDRRIELLIPILDVELKDKVKEILKVYTKDNTKAWLLKYNGEYGKAKGRKNIIINSQEHHLNKGSHKTLKVEEIEEFMPLTSSGN